MRTRFFLCAFLLTVVVLAPLSTAGASPPQGIQPQHIEQAGRATLLPAGLTNGWWALVQPYLGQTTAASAKGSQSRLDEMSTTAPGTVEAGSYHSCAIKSDGTVICWGYNEYGESTPPAGRFKQISGGVYHTCGVREDGRAICWGAPYQGRTAAPDGTFLQVSAAFQYSCGLKTDSTVVCWGD